MSDLPETRHSLILRLRELDDSAAWGEFVAIYEAAIYRFARRKRLHHADAEDVTQEVLRAVLRRIPNWEASDQQGCFRAWLFRVTRNLFARAWHEQLIYPYLV